MKNKKPKAKTVDNAAFGAETIEVRPGYVVIDCSTATGGVQHVRTPTVEERDGAGTRANWKTTRFVDHTQIVKESEALVKRVDYVLRTHASRTGFGWFADDKAVRKIREDVAKVREAAEELNDAASKHGSERRTYISVIFAKLDVSNQDVAQEIYRVARENLQEIYNCLRAGAVGQDLDTAKVRAKNQGNVASGILRTAMDQAMGMIDGWRQDVKAALKNGVAPEKAGAALDLSSLEAAIQLLSPMWSVENGVE